AGAPVAGVRLAGPFPQPSAASTTLRLIAPPESAFHVDVFDASGRFVQSLPEGRMGAQGETVIALDTSRWAAGLYLVSARSGGGKATRQLVVAR
ncbi:MAG: T9SS type A sorting domain-containing protein, partial [Candidatus Eisenbacteria bacterium]|nr:T9SS type A sorting domain-containing protein [Candidatus Eisenbacteria bacterium]